MNTVLNFLFSMSRISAFSIFSLFLFFSSCKTNIDDLPQNVQEGIHQHEVLVDSITQITYKKLSQSQLKSVDSVFLRIKKEMETVLTNMNSKHQWFEYEFSITEGSSRFLTLSNDESYDKNSRKIIILKDEPSTKTTTRSNHFPTLITYKSTKSPLIQTRSGINYEKVSDTEFDLTNANVLTSDTRVYIQIKKHVYKLSISTRKVVEG